MAAVGWYTALQRDGKFVARWLRLRHGVLTAAGCMAKDGVWQPIHETLLAELRRRGQLDMARAIVDSSSIGAMLARKEPVRHVGAARP